MRRLLSATVTLVTALIIVGSGQLASPAALGPDLSVIHAASSRALKGKAAKSRAKAASSATTYAKWCAKVGANAEARLFYGVAGVCSGTPEKLAKDYSKVAAKEDDKSHKYESGHAKQSAKLLEKGGRPLFKFIQYASKKGMSEGAREEAAIW